MTIMRDRSGVNTWVLFGIKPGFLKVIKTLWGFSLAGDGCK